MRMKPQAMTTVGTTSCHCHEIGEVGNCGEEYLEKILAESLLELVI
jgi:hypothetical protein